MSLQSKIVKLGLSKKESEVYIASLRVGSATTTEIIRETALPASTVRDVLVELSQRGLISRYRKSNTFVYTPTDPAMLQEKIEEQLTIANDVVPRLADLYASSGAMPTIRYFDHRTGFDVFLREVISEAQEVRAIGSTAVHTYLPEYFPKFTQQRIQKKIPAKLIMPNSQDARAIQARDHDELRVTRILQSDKDIQSSIFLWKKKIAIFSVDDSPTVLLIENKSMAQVFHMVHEQLWQSLK